MYLKDTVMRRCLIFLALISSVMTACQRTHDYSNTEWQEKDVPDWENTAVNTLNTEKPHATMVSFPDNGTALTAGWRESENVMSLDGRWKFTLF